MKITHRQLLPPSTCGTGKIIRAQECLMSHEQDNIVLGGRGYVEGLVIEMLRRL